jgi:hypothetical protein
VQPETPLTSAPFFVGKIKFPNPARDEWAGINRGGDAWGIPRYYVLSHLAADRVVCELRGQGAQTFRQLADRAGAMLPVWPAQRYPSLLSDVGSFARYCDPARVHWAPLAGDVWNHGMVTDHRGNEERWLGLVFGSLMPTRLEHLNLVTRPGDVAQCCDGGAVNAMMTLRGLNLFAASARAIELAGLIPALPPALPPQSVVGPQVPAEDGSGKKPGRPPDSRKGRIVNYVRDVASKEQGLEDNSRRRVQEV